MLHDGGDGVVPDLVLRQDNAGIRIRDHVLDGVGFILDVQRNELQDGVDHLGGRVALGLNADGVRRLRDGRIEVVRDDDEIAVAGIGQSLEQIRTDDIRNSS